MQKTKLIKRDQAILATFERRINLNVRIVKSRKAFDRKKLKKETRTLLLAI